MSLRLKNLVALSAVVLLAAGAESKAEPVSAGIATGAAIVGIGTAVWSGASYIAGVRSMAYAEADGIVDSDPAGVTQAQLTAGTYAVNGGWFSSSAASLADTGVTAQGTQLKTDANSTWAGPVVNGNVTFPTKQRGNKSPWYYKGTGFANETLGSVIKSTPPAGGLLPSTLSTVTVPINIQYTVNPATWQTDTTAGDFMDVQFSVDAYAIPDTLSQGSAPSSSDAFWQQSVLNGEVDLLGGPSPSLDVTGNVLSASMFSPTTTDGSGNVNAVLSSPQTLSLTLNVQVPSTLSSFSFVMDTNMTDDVAASGVPEPCTLAIGIFGAAAAAGIRPRRRQKRQ